MTDTITDKGLVLGMRRRGAIILGVFGLIWAFAGSSGIGDTTGRLVVQIAAVAVTLLVVFIGYRNSDVPAIEPAIPEDWNRRYNLIGIIQGVAIGLAVFTLIQLDYPGLIPAVVCLIVGLHFLPLADVFDLELYRWTGIALCTLAAIGLALWPVADDGVVLATVGLGAAIILWSTVMKT